MSPYGVLSILSSFVPFPATSRKETFLLLSTFGTKDARFTRQCRRNRFIK